VFNDDFGFTAVSSGTERGTEYSEFIEN